MMDDKEFRALMDLMMVSDPWPLDAKSHDILLDLLLFEAEARGYDSWIVAYHEMPRT